MARDERPIIGRVGVAPTFAKAPLRDDGTDFVVHGMGSVVLARVLVDVVP